MAQRSQLSYITATNFTLEDGLPLPQNWMLCQDALGYIYSANNEALIVYDGEPGKKWRKVEIGGKQARSVCIGSNNTVYVGGIGEFGFIEIVSSGKKVYRSISKGVVNEEFGAYSFNIRNFQRNILYC